MSLCQTKHLYKPFYSIKNVSKIETFKSDKALVKDAKSK